METFRFFDHTGDIGVEVFGESIRTLFQHAGEALTEIITDRKTVRARESRRISLKADGIEDLLIRWLNEFVFLFDTTGLLFTVFDIASIDEGHVEATVQGEIYDEKRHPIKTTIKGATYHQLEVVREDGIWRARIILDI
jgi:SHS2 domain-containing protein